MTVPGDALTAFWRGRRVLLTGHTGFKGAWLGLWLKSLGADVTGYALAPATDPNLWALVGDSIRSEIGDIRDEAGFRRAVLRADPQIVIHMAAQALVRESYLDPIGTYATNVLGTASLLQACRSLQHLQCALVVTSDKVYRNEGEGLPFVESDPLGGHDPYSSSKACTELLTMSFRDSYFSKGAPLATVRAGNVIGGGDWSQNRVIPDCVRALRDGVPVALRFPEAVRPWQHVLEPLSGYLALAQGLVESPGTTPTAMNFGPDPTSFCTVREVVDAFGTRFDGKPGWRHDRTEHPAEAQTLTLSSALARQTLGWRPRLDLGETLAWTADWYSAHSEGKNMLAYSESQILRFRRLMQAPS